MNKNLFIKALNRNETKDFFLGNGNYFSRNRESHNHDYVLFITGWVKKYIDISPKENLGTFFSALTDLIDDIDCQKNSLTAVLSILLGISISIRKQHYQMSDINPEIAHKFLITLKKHFLICKFSQEEKEKIKLYSDRIRENKCDKIADAISLS
ncbi:MAG: hypothetical protein ACI9NA_000297 [Gammaproteobacteria bacterium]|jgi:hypothetical protein|uniref:hypothetical protein n=1 Tax=Thalassolituus oleivorans TaxID=187493 RepID=UPI0009492499|nr:hypothetical protein [Thalassolituus oleivorans]APR66244.1 hypothetical protein CN03_04425 [Thalassolituus oleivorans]|tara:strand:+ start:348 stop:809 length:462 start_codon:yes stop_codon:yes gene_type:complete